MKITLPYFNGDSSSLLDAFDQRHEAEVLVECGQALAAARTAAGTKLAVESAKTMEVPASL
jgi:hypothetical protein